jgi:hypothetical protein
MGEVPADSFGADASPPISCRRWAYRPPYPRRSSLASNPLFGS